MKDEYDFNRWRKKGIRGKECLLGKDRTEAYGFISGLVS